MISSDFCDCNSPIQCGEKTRNYFCESCEKMERAFYMEYVLKDAVPMKPAVEEKIVFETRLKKTA